MEKTRNGTTSARTFAPHGVRKSNDTKSRGLDQVTGATLEANHISLTDAETGKIPQTSTLPAGLPGQN